MDSKSRRCIVIDPFEALAQRVETLVRCQNSKVVAVLDTHAHVDHDSIRVEILGAMSEFAVESAHTNDLLGWPEVADGTCTLDDGSQAEWMRISDELVIVKTDFPGHTKIGVAYFVGSLDGDRLTKSNVKYAFLGDMILMGGIGRTDFPCSSIEMMYESMRRLPELLEPDTLLCPTHDYNSEFATTLEAELAENQFLRSILDESSPMSADAFAEAKPAIDADIADATNSELVCGLIRKSSDSCSMSLDKAELQSLLAENDDLLIVDVREPHEFQFEQGWNELGFDEIPRNVPLTRLSAFLPELIETHANSERKVIFLCRSGKRSGRAAEIARRLGIANASSVLGGLALNTMRKTSMSQSDMEYMI